MIIGLAGRAGVGKDTVASFIREYDKEYRIERFADRIKTICSTIFNWPYESLNEFEFKESVCPVWGFTPRRALQLLGTEFGRALDPDIWIKMTMNSLGEDPKVVIADVRFENEAAAIRAAGGRIVHIVRDKQENETNFSTHNSEAGIVFDPSDILLTNDATLEELEYTVELLMHYLSQSGDAE